jgi:tetratricopeptide (TPR) repeat protein
MRKAFDFPPYDARDYNDLAWVLATCSDPKVADGRRAVELARKAVELAPDDRNYWNTLGVAYSRIGDWKGAVQAWRNATPWAPRGLVPSRTPSASPSPTGSKGTAKSGR